MRNLEIYKEYLPDWGPYSKKYMGVSRACEDGQIPGARFDLVVFPTLANSGVPVPNVTVPSNYHPWQAAADLRYYSYRYDLEWKDQCYAEVSFSQMEAGKVVIRTEFVNRTKEAQYGCLNYFAAMEYPYPYEYYLALPDKCEFWDAVSYDAYEYARPRPWDCLNPDGTKKGEFYDPDFIGHHGLGDRVNKDFVFEIRHWDFRSFGADEGDFVRYRRNTAKDYVSGVLYIRALIKEDREDAFYLLEIRDDERNRLNFRKNVVFRKDGSVIVDSNDTGGGADRKTVAADSECRRAVREKKDCSAASDEAARARTRAAEQGCPILYEIPIGRLPEGLHTISLISHGNSALELDCFALTEWEDRSVVRAERKEYEVHPAISHEEGTLTYEYGACDTKICFALLSPLVKFRNIESGVLEDAWISRLSNGDETFDDVLAPFGNAFPRKHSSPGYYHNSMIPSIFIKPGESRVEYAVIGDERWEISKEDCERIYRECRADAFSFQLKEDGGPYELSTRILGATELTNVVYPIHLDDGFIKHHTPGKRWDSLYTWDSGMIAMGLRDMNQGLAEYILDTYLAELDNKNYAFVHHGTPIPTHLYLYQEMLNHTEEKDHLLAYYDRAKRYYEFLAGRGDGSVTARFQSGLTTTFDYFFNCSGMDDLPPQMYVKEHAAAGGIAPVISTCQVIRTAKILLMAAEHLGYGEDVRQYEQDMNRLTDALSQAWDEESGYFGYLVHDEEGRADHILRTEDGENYNKTVEGIYPLIAGACSGEQEERLLAHLKNPEELFSRAGISSVDQSASYFIKDGYWNGNVWFPHQWFIWKTMLDMGEGEFAYEIAHRALEVWKQEVDRSYYTFEQINIETGRGGWFHHFSGLSSPVSVWASAYYRPGNVSTGFDLWIEFIRFNDTTEECCLKFRKYSHRSCVILVSMAARKEGYSVYFTDDFGLVESRAEFKERTKGTLEISLAEERMDGILRIF